MEGIKTKDFTAITSVGATVKFTLDEVTAPNLAFFAMGDVDTTVPGTIVINGLSKTEFTGDLKVVGSNDVGQKIDWVGTVSFVPTGSFNFITDSDDFSTIEIEGEVQKDVDGNFGVWTIHDTVTP